MKKTLFASLTMVFICMIQPGTVYSQDKKTYDEPPIFFPADHNNSEENTKVKTIYIDSAIQVDTVFRNIIHQFSPDLNKKYNSEEFQYDADRTRNIWQEFKEWLTDKIQQLFNIADRNRASRLAGILETGLYSLIFLTLIIFIIRTIRNKEGRWLLKKNDKKLDNDIQSFEEEMKSVNFKKDIADMVSEKDYRQATRYYFIWLLKAFEDRDIIKYTPDKTSEDYIKEIKNKKLKHDYTYAAYLYNYIWFGKFDIDKDQFDIIESAFKKMISDD